MKDFIQKYKHGLLLCYILIYLPWFTLLEQRTITHYTSIHIRLDDFVPFCEWFAIPYVLWFVYITATILFFFLFSKEDYYKCCTFLFVGMTICLIIYTIWPNGQNLRPDSFSRDNILIDLVKAFYGRDTSTNVCPSIHVFNSIGAHIAISKSAKFKNHKWVVISSFILMVLICLSTVFLKQHSVFDGICALVLSLVMYLLVYKIDYAKVFNKEKSETALDTNY